MQMSDRDPRVLGHSLVNNPVRRDCGELSSAATAWAGRVTSTPPGLGGGV